MAPSKSAAAEQSRTRVVKDARQTLSDLKEVSRWQRGLLDRLERVIQRLEAMESPADKPGK